MRVRKKHRIVRTAVLTVALIVLTPLLYTCSLLSLAFCIGAGWLPSAPSPMVMAYATPLKWYQRHNLPGGRDFEDIIIWTAKRGHTFTHGD